MADTWPASTADAIKKIKELTERETAAIKEGKN